MTDLDTLREKLEKIRRHPHIAGLMMVEVCNALPALLDELEKLRVEREELRKGVNWALENLGAGIEWGGPFDDEHQQGVYHCTHCDAQRKPNSDGKEERVGGCRLAELERLAAGEQRP